MTLGDVHSRLNRRRLLVLGLSGLTGVGALAACGGTSSTTNGPAAATNPAAPATAPTAATSARSSAATTAASTTASAKATASVSRKAGELLITSWNNPSNGATIDYIGENAKAFGTKHPDIPVTFDQLGANYEDKVLAQAAGGTPPDVIQQGGRDFGLYVTKGVLLALDTFIARDHYDVSDFYPITMQLTTWKQKVYGLPDDLNLLGLYYNKDLFDKASVQYPPTDWGAKGWSWQDFEDVARKLTVTSSGQVSQFGANIGYGTTSFATALWSYGGAYLNQGWTTCTMDQQQAIAAMQFMQDLLLKDKSQPSPADLQKDSSNKRYFDGNVAMYVAGAYFSNPASQSIKSFAWDVAALPSGSAGPFSVTGGSQGSSWSVTTGSKLQDQAWQLVQWMAGPESQTVLAEHGWIPGRKSVGTQVYLSAKSPPLHKKVFVDATEHVKMIPLIPDWTDIDSAVSKQMANLWLGSKSAQDVGAAITQQVNGLLKQLPADQR